ncbi:unnamed protein product, partial [Polarella glacialis]
DMVAALRDVNGRYVGNRPVRLKKSSWKDKGVDSEKNANSGLRKLSYCIPQDSKKLQKFKKLKIKQDPNVQKERMKLAKQQEELANMARKKK